MLGEGVRWRGVLSIEMNCARAALLWAAGPQPLLTSLAEHNAFALEKRQHGERSTTNSRRLTGQQQLGTRVP